MSMEDKSDEDAIRALHIHYCQHTGNALTLTLHRMDLWSSWARNGWTAVDLKLAIDYVRKRFWDRNRPEIVRGMLRFSRLVEQHENFEELLCMARDAKRNERPPRTTLDTALSAMHRNPAPAVDAVKTPSSVLKQGYENLWKAIE